MNIIINENERGYLYRNGGFEKLLNPGKHFYLAFLGYTVTKIKLSNLVDTAGNDINVLMKDRIFAESVTQIKVPDNYIGLPYIDGRINSILTSGEYTFWNIFKKHSFELIDISNPEVSKEFDTRLFQYIPQTLYTKIQVSEGETAQANVISRREEVASTRSLLNTAKLMDENHTLYKLKELEYLERICDKVGNISISGGNNLLSQLNELLCQKS
ncbi:MAG: hypothetical protein Q8936_00285 [Bacillota bacterium]|nr:hypothetical protein [Bacillota bacterium]